MTENQKHILDEISSSDILTYLSSKFFAQSESKRRLQKENAELRLKLEALDGQTPWKDIKDKSEVIGQLTKAKEIIKKYMRFKPVVGGVQYYHEEYEQTEKEAEQFLKEIDK